MASRKSLTSASELKNSMLRQTDQNNKGCLSIRFLLREFCILRLVDLNNYLNIASSKNQSDPRDEQWMNGNAMPFFCLLGTYSIGQTRKQSEMWLDFFFSFITDTRKIKKRNKN